MYLNNQFLEETIFAVADGYCCVNLTKDMLIGVIYQNVDGTKYNLSEQMGLPENVLFTEAVATWASTIPEEERQTFLETLDRDKLLRRFENGERHISFSHWIYTTEHKRMFAENHFVMFQDESTQEVLAVNYVMDRTCKKGKKIPNVLCKDYTLEYLPDSDEKLQEINDRLEEQIKTIGGLSNAYFAVYWVDLCTNTCKAVKNIPYFEQAVHHCKTADDVVEVFVNLCVMPEDKEKMSAFTDWRRLERIFEKDNVVVEEFHGAFLPWEWCRASWIVASRNEEGAATSALFAVEEISASIAERKQREREHKLLEEQNHVISGLSKEYATVWLITQDGRTCVKYQDRGADSVPTGEAFSTEKELDYTEGMQHYIAQYLCEEDKEEFSRKVKYEVVLQELKKQAIYSVIYRRKYLGKKEYFQLSFALTDRNGKGNDFVAGFKNVDAVVQAERQKNEILSRALSEAEYANQAKTQFLNNMSHDIRTPINGIIGMLNIIQKSEDDPQRVKDCLKKIEFSSKLLLSLINDVLDMAKLEKTTVILNNESININEVCEEIGAAVVFQAEAAGITVTAEHDDYENTWVWSSSLHLKKILLNLFTNSIKYNKPGGSIHTSMRTIERTQDHIVCQFTIQDTGLGMSEDFVKNKLFTPFVQADNSSRSNYMGTGLGMSIVKQIIEKMNGSITVESKLGEGTCFTVVLPFKLDHEGKHEKTKNIADVTIKGAHLLLAEDNDLNLEIADFMLKENGAQIVAVRNGLEALEKFETADAGTFDAILMDVMMPVMDGLTATRKIRALERVDAKTIPIIAMTANAFREDAEKCIEAGMNAHLVKPLDIKKVITTIAQFLPDKQ